MPHRSHRSRSTLIRMLLGCALGLAVSSAYATSEGCEAGSVDEQQLGGGDCRTVTQGAASGPTNVDNATITPLPSALTSIEVCPAWSTAVDSIPSTSGLTFAELEVGSSDGRYTGVLVLSYARVAGTDQVVFDWVPLVSPGWSLANPANQLPSSPVATATINACHFDTDWPTAKWPFYLSVTNDQLRVTRNGATVFERRLQDWQPLQPRGYRVKNFRANSASALTIYGRWRADRRDPDSGLRWNW